MIWRKNCRDRSRQFLSLPSVVRAFTWTRMKDFNISQRSLPRLGLKRKCENRPKNWNYAKIIQFFGKTSNTFKTASRVCSRLKQIFANIFGKTNVFVKICQNLMSSKYFHKNEHFVSHVADRFCLFVISFRKKQHLREFSFFPYIFAGRYCENVKIMSTRKFEENFSIYSNARSTRAWSQKGVGAATTVKIVKFTVRPPLRTV